MQKNTMKFLKDRVCINVLAKDLKNAQEVFQAAEGYAVVGILSKNFDSIHSASQEMTKWAQAIDNNISIGLGAGDPKQSFMVAELTKKLHPNHANQVFTGVGLSVENYAQPSTWINCLVSPSGKPGFVKINTGPSSSQTEDAIVKIETAIAMIKDMGGNSVKYFPMKGLQTKEEFLKVAQACQKMNFALEPTGGIDLNNYREILTIAVSAGVKKIIPHIYSSIIDENGNTKIEDVKKIMKITKEVLDE